MSEESHTKVELMDIDISWLGSLEAMVNLYCGSVTSFERSPHISLQPQNLENQLDLRNKRQACATSNAALAAETPPRAFLFPFVS